MYVPLVIAGCNRKNASTSPPGVQQALPASPPLPLCVLQILEQYRFLVFLADPTCARQVHMNAVVAGMAGGEVRVWETLDMDEIMVIPAPSVPSPALTTFITQDFASILVGHGSGTIFCKHALVPAWHILRCLQLHPIFFAYTITSANLNKPRYGKHTKNHGVMHVYSLTLR